MFLSPVTSMRLVRARAKGGSFWYCRETGGRLLTLVMAKHFFGADGAREIWVRADLSRELSGANCPSCTKPMKLVNEPKWIGGHEVDVCRACHLIWIDGQEHVEHIPTPDDLIVPQGDSTIVAEVGKLQAQIEIAKEMKRSQADSLVGPVSHDINVQLRGFIGLPVELHDRAAPVHTWATGLVAISILFIYGLLTTPEVVQEWGFYPAHPFKNFGLNAFTGTFLHAGWFHVLLNAYFFAIFSDDIEERLGFVRFLLLVFATAVLSLFIATPFSGSPEVPHIGLSGVVMAILIFYALEFPKTQIGYLLPVFHNIAVNSGGRARVFGSQWVKVPVWFVALVYFAFDLGGYFVFERNRLGNVGHSIHLSGLLVGALLWFLLARPKTKASESKEVVSP